MWGCELCVPATRKASGPAYGYQCGGLRSVGCLGYDIMSLALSITLGANVCGLCSML